jgi:DDE superfamily endonuclease
MCWSGFRERVYRCLTRRADAVFELTDALLCTDGPVKSLVGLSPAPGAPAGHGAMYDALNHGRIDVESLRRELTKLPLPRASDGRLVLAVDVSPWLRPDGNCSPQRSFCHTHGLGKDEHRKIPGRPYSIIAALETGRTSWTALLDGVRLPPGADVTTITCAQICMHHPLL